MSADFWNAFSAGLAAPVMLFGETPGYNAYTKMPTPAQSFAAVGSLLGRVATGVKSPVR